MAIALMLFHFSTFAVHDVWSDGVPAVPGAAERRHPEALCEHGPLPQTPLLHPGIRATHRQGARRLQGRCQFLSLNESSYSVMQISHEKVA